jgi:CubicO group peptidase (beta-lactamase class C family)
MMKKIAFTFLLFLAAHLHSYSQQVPLAKMSIARLEKDVPRLLKESDVPGLTIALIRDGRLVWSGAFGLANADTKKRVTPNTVFEAASLSKPVFAYAVLKLVDEGKLNLDTPLNKYLGNNYDVGGDERMNLITARRVLSHTSGFPNWRPDGSKSLSILFTPGEKFSYSGEGMVYLSRVVVKITGMDFEEFMQQYALRPLGMTASSYIWQDRYDSLKAYRHDMLGKMSGRNQPTGGHAGGTVREQGNAAASLCTTAIDYAKFVIAVLNGTGLKKDTWAQMLTPQVRVDEKYPPVAWGLGLGLETMPEGEYFWHWGDNGDSKAYVAALVSGKDAVLYFADGSNGLSFTSEILDDAIGGYHPALAHLDYDGYNSPSRGLLKSILSKGAAQALSEYKETRKQASMLMIPESKINDIGYSLLRMKKPDEALEVFKQNTEDFQQSWNVWDSYAEALMNKGDKALAIKYYEKSLELNSGNSNAAEQLKKLRNGH